MALVERYSDPLGGLKREGKGQAPSTTRPARVRPITRVTKPADLDHERRLHEQLMRERDTGFTDGAKMLIAVGILACLSLRTGLDLDARMTLQAFFYALPVLGIVALAAHQARRVLPAFGDSGAGMVVVALVVGIGAFYVFFQDGHMSRMKREARDGREAASPVTPR